MSLREVKSTSTGNYGRLCQRSEAHLPEEVIFTTEIGKFRKRQKKGKDWEKSLK